MTNKTGLRLALRPGPADHSKTAFPHTQRQFNQYDTPFETLCARAKLFAAMLKEQAADVMRDVSTCPPDTLPAHVKRLDGLTQIMQEVIRYRLVPEEDCRLSGSLLHPATCQDFVEMLNLTRQRHRAPCLAGLPQPQLDRIEQKLETLAAYLAGYFGKELV